MSILARSVSAVVLLTAAACGDALMPEGMTVRDSMGIRIVEYAGEPAPTHSVAFSAEPLYRHGHVEGDYLFQMIGVGALQPDGGAVVFDSGTREVVTIDSDGELRQLLARSGQGPAEVRAVRAILVSGQDTVIMEDAGNRKLMRFENGELAWTRPVDGYLMPRGIDPDGNLLTVTARYSPRFEAPWLPGYMVRQELEGDVFDTVAAYDMAQHLGPEGRQHPFPSQGFATATGGEFIYGRTDIPELTWRGPDGGIWQIVRWNPMRSYPTDGHWDSYVEQLRSELPRMNPQLSRAEAEALVQQQLESYEVDSSEPVPIFITLEDDGSGGVWMADWTPAISPEALKSYAWIQSGGEWLGSVELPERFQLLDVSGTKALGILRDEMDVESVAVFEVIVTPLEGQ